MVVPGEGGASWRGGLGDGSWLARMVLPGARGTSRNGSPGERSGGERGRLPSGGGSAGNRLGTPTPRAGTGGGGGGGVDECGAGRLTTMAVFGNVDGCGTPMCHSVRPSGAFVAATFGVGWELGGRGAAAPTRGGGGGSTGAPGGSARAVVDQTSAAVSATANGAANRAISMPSLHDTYHEGQGGHDRVFPRSCALAGRWRGHLMGTRSIKAPRGPTPLASSGGAR